MTRVSTAAVALTALLIFSTGAQAAPVFYDFSLASTGAVFPLGADEPFTGLNGDLKASAYYYDGDSWEVSGLIARNITGDNGLGNCSPGEVCNEDGNYNELSQLVKTEAILLEKPAGTVWTELWVSSLDSGGTGDSEEGRLLWGNDSSTLFTAALNLSAVSNFSYPGSVPGVEGQLVLPGGFSTTATYLLFLPGSGLGTHGQNNDYLVWGATLDVPTVEEHDLSPVPEPASLVLLGSGLIALARKRRRDGRR